MYIHLSALSWSHFLTNFHQNWHKRKNCKSKNELVMVNIAPPIPIWPQKNILGQEVLKIHANINNPTSALNVRKSPKFPHLEGNQGWGTRWRQILDRKWKYGHIMHTQWKIRNITLISWPNRRNFSTWLWGRYHVKQNVFRYIGIFILKLQKHCWVEYNVHCLSVYCYAINIFKVCRCGSYQKQANYIMSTVIKTENLEKL